MHRWCYSDSKPTWSLDRLTFVAITTANRYFKSSDFEILIYEKSLFDIFQISRVGAFGFFRLPRRLSWRLRSGTVQSQFSPVCELARHDSLSPVKTQSQSSPLYVCTRRDTVSVQSCICASATRHTFSPAYVCARHDTVSVHSLYKCVGDATQSQSSPVCVWISLQFPF